MLRGAAVLLLTAVAACGHGEPFAAPDTGTGEPLASGAPPWRLTYNPGSDRQPSWLPDGSGLLYTAERADREAQDHCLGLLPPTGGRSRRTICYSGPGERDSTNAIESAAVSHGGRLAYLLVSKRPGQTGWTTRRLVVTTLSEPGRLTTVLELPSPGYGHDFASQLVWLGESRLAYRADHYEMVPPCAFCDPVEVTTGRFVALAELADTTAVLHFVPGTQYATSVAADGDSALLFTVAGNGSVFRHVLASGVAGVLWDFGTTVGNARLAAGRLVVTLGEDQGQVAMVDLATGAQTTVSATNFGRLALSPDGRRLVAQTPGMSQDLYLLDLP